MRERSYDASFLLMNRFRFFLPSVSFPDLSDAKNGLSLWHCLTYLCRALELIKRLGLYAEVVKILVINCWALSLTTTWYFDKFRTRSLLRLRHRDNAANSIPLGLHPLMSENSMTNLSKINPWLLCTATPYPKSTGNCIRVAIHCYL